MSINLIATVNPLQIKSVCQTLKQSNCIINNVMHNIGIISFSSDNPDMDMLADIRGIDSIEQDNAVVGL